MSQDQHGTGRRRRRGRRGGGGGSEGRPTRENTSAKPRRQGPPPRADQDQWQWLTFPVIFAFGLGIVLMGLFYQEPLIGFFVFIPGVTIVAFGVAHIAARRWAQNRRRRG